MRRFLSTKGERYEFEMNMILDAKEGGIPLCEVPIETVYIEDNRSSHFNPLKDSLRIYAVFGKFILSSLSSFVLDLLLYMLFFRLLTPTLADEQAIVAAAFAARALSSLYNFTVNRNGVFKSRANAGRSMVRYAVLCVLQITVSALATSALYSVFRFGETLWKFLVDTVLFLISFRIQRGWVFK
jgi:putative flippase GtrA